MKIRESGEMYLEHILTLQQKKGAVRAVDVASLSGYSKPSVSRALGLLKQAGFLEVEEGGNILLTPKGHALAQKIMERHSTLTHFLQKLGVDERIAAEDACKIEHVISDETFEKIKAFLR